MRRLHTLEQLTLDFSGPWTSCSVWDSMHIWHECKFLIQIIIENSRSVRKLGLEGLQPELTGCHPDPKSLVPELLRFEEIDFGFFSTGIAVEILEWVVLADLLTGVLSSGEDSKLKVLPMPDCEHHTHPSYVTKARKYFTVRFKETQ